MAAIVGLGIFLTLAEEHTAQKLETMFAAAELHITSRLDGLAKRLDDIDHSISKARTEQVSEGLANRLEVIEHSLSKAHCE